VCVQHSCIESLPRIIPDNVLKTETNASSHSHFLKRL
jgi:hypothetical protein